MNTITINRRNRRPMNLRLVFIDRGRHQIIAAINEDGYCTDFVANTYAIQDDNEDTDIVPQAGRFFSRDSYYGDSDIEDILIEAGHMRVVGRVDTHYYTYAELELDEEWLSTLPVMPMLDSSDAVDGIIKVGYEFECSQFKPTAFIKRGDWSWSIDMCGDNWMISASNRTNRDKGFTTGFDNSLLEAWLEAMRLEKAMDEFVDMGNQIAEKYGVSFIYNLIEHVAAGYWYLEG